MCVLVSRCFELHYVIGLGRIQQAVQRLQSMAFVVNVVVPVIVAGLHASDAVRLQPASNV